MVTSPTKTKTISTASNTAEAKEQIGAVHGFFIGGAAACAAVTFSNPWELVKTRLQLQGELARASANSPKPYKNIFQAFYIISRYEGLRGVQQGLGPAYTYQLVMNGLRLGLYDPIRSSLTSAFNASNTSMLVSMTSAGISGVVGAAIGSPLYLVKTRMQSCSSQFAVGHQHRYRNIFHALNSIWKEGGLRGLYRGAAASMLRTGVGSSVQLSGYFLVKRWAIEKTGMSDNDILIHSFSSMLTGVFVCIAMNPFDVISTRMYNQKANELGKGSLYKNTFDCFAKTIRTEGLMGLYKGFGAHYLRIGPHTVLMLVFLEQFRGLYIKYWNNELINLHHFTTSINEKNPRKHELLIYRDNGPRTLAMSGTGGCRSSAPEQTFENGHHQQSLGFFASHSNSSVASAPITPTSPMICSNSPKGTTLPININNNHSKRANVYYPSNRYHQHHSSPYYHHQQQHHAYNNRTPGSSYTSIASSPPMSPSLRSMRRGSLGSQNSELFGSLVGSYEESILNGRMSTAPSKPITFIAQIGVLGRGKCKSSLKCPPHVNLVFPAYFYNLEDDDNPTPYVGNVDLENGLIDERFKKFPGGYRLPLKGQLQVVIKNPNKTAVKFFLIPYDFSDISAGHKTFIRQKSYSLSPFEVEESSSSSSPHVSKPVFRYAIHLQFCSPAKRKLYLYKYIRVVFANRVPDGSEKLKIVCEGPGEPRYVPIGSYNGLSFMSDEDEDGGEENRARKLRRKRKKSKEDDEQ
ncbi:12135_t:CDS:2 [Ambispora gerdemannii]|uniref:12135_t:CDS:1 n=1 Tax=Ambispora gerdemannii TaxID=144530 RepID=A0A9N8V0U7_9GLOM|nr:12135_t:CDS:2 [Ambispora gerdemannii]